MNLTEKKFEICVRAIILNKNKVLVCKNLKKDYYFFPGGHVEFGENAKAALFREIKEELGISIKKYKFIGFVENIFKERWGKHHEFNLIFEAVPARINTKSREGHLLFSFLDIGQLSRNKVLPVALKKFLLKWLNDKKVFWGSQIFNKYTHGF